MVQLGSGSIIAALFDALELIWSGMPKRNINITGQEGLSPSSSDATKSVSTSVSASASSEPADDVTRTYAVINQMVVDGVIKNYALGGAMAAFFYIEPSFTADMDMFCLLAHEPHPSGIVLLDPLIDYLKGKGYQPTALGAMIEALMCSSSFQKTP